MPSKSKADATADAIAANVPRKGFSIPEFCASFSISEGFYKKLRDKGLGPRETHVLDRIIITDKDANEWPGKIRRASEQKKSGNTAA
jgi:hypothetical protein